MNPARLMTQEGYISAPTGTVDAFGQAAYGTAELVLMRVQAERRVGRGVDESASTTTVVYLTAQVTTAHKLWLPGENPASAPARRPRNVLSSPHPSGTPILYKAEL